VCGLVEIARNMDFLEQLQRQKSFLQRSCEIYDRGDTDEAVRIAVALRVLFHDTQSSTSLLSHLGIKQTTSVLTTLRPGFSKDSKAGVMTISIPFWLGSDGDRRPPLDCLERNEFVTVKEWWEQVVMGSNEMPTRKAVILGAANQDGGAHVDAAPNDVMKELLAGVGTYQGNQSGVLRTAKLTNHHLPLLRQFAHEVLNSPDVWQSIKSQAA
jgi:hypothetical protein